MEEMIVTGIVGVCVSLLATAKIAQKTGKRKIVKAERAKADAWQATLERAKAEREAHPERFQASQVLGVGVDGLQHKYQTIVVLDPVDESSGKYDDYRQLLWRITGSRQQHDVNVIEFYFKELEN